MFHDLRFAVRSLARRKGLFLVAVITLAVGVGASTSLFSMVNGVLLQPLPYRDSERLAVLWHVFGQGAQDLPAMHPLDYRDYRQRSRTLEELTIATGRQGILGGATNPEIVTVGWVNDNFFPFLGVDPAIGRHFRSDEAVPGGASVMLLSRTRTMPTPRATGSGCPRTASVSRPGTSRRCGRHLSLGATSPTTTFSTRDV
jgi:MacB-like periplasmic core domain